MSEAEARIGDEVRDDGMQVVSFTETQAKIAQMDGRARSLGMSRGDYLRWLIDRECDSKDRKR